MDQTVNRKHLRRTLRAGTAYYSSCRHNRGPGPTREWGFNLSLNGRPIGCHRFELKERRDEVDLLSEGHHVRVLFVTAYRCMHDSRELWRGDCLGRVTSRSDDNYFRNTVPAAMTPDADTCRVTRRRYRMRRPLDRAPVLLRPGVSVAGTTRKGHRLRYPL